jgi:hypothetical protein
MKVDSRQLILSITMVAAILTLSFTAFATTLTAPSGFFNVTHNQIAVNHTNGFNNSINVTASNLVPFQAFTVLNGSTSIGPSYHQPNISSICGADGLGLKPRIQIGTSTNTSNSTFQLDGGGSINVSVQLGPGELGCMPGRWFGGLIIRNITNSTDNVTINVTIDIPITSSSAAFNRSAETGISIFNGTMEANSQTYHSYFINASIFPGATSILVNLTSQQFLDMFLLDSAGNLLGKSIGYTDSSIASGPVTNEFYELRIYGNYSSSVPYNGSVIFSSMNLTNSSSPVYPLVLSNPMLPSTAVTYNLVLSNNGTLAMPNVSESSEIALVNRMYGNSSGDYFFLVPDFVNSARFSVNWTGPGSVGIVNYSMLVTAPNGTVVGNSSNVFLSANVSGVDREEFVEIGNLVPGIWKVSVFANNVPSGNKNNYAVTARMFVNPSQWISTNFSSVVNKTFTSSDSPNSSRILQMNLTVPNASLDGSYEGFLGYTTSTGAAFRSPILFSVKSGSIIVNQSLNSSTYTIQDNIGQNGTRTFSIGINNTGSLDIVYNTTSSPALFLDPDHYVNFSFSNTSGILTQKANGTITFNYVLNTSTFNNTEGVYTGWVFFNATEARPSPGHNLTIILNLTNNLRFRFIEILSEGQTDNTINNTVLPEEVLVRFGLDYINGTPLSDNDGYAFGSSITNFTFYMRHSNVSSWTVPVNRSLTNGSMVKKQGALANTSVYTDTLDRFEVWATVPENTLGGLYDFIGVAVYNNTSTYVGSAQFQNKIDVMNAALFMSTNFTGCSFGSSCAPSTFDLTENHSTRVYVLINNYGTVAASPVTVNITESCREINVTTVQENCTGGSSSAGAWTSLTPAAGESCFLSWDIGAQAGGPSCSVSVEGTQTGLWFSSSGINLTVKPNLASSSSSSSSSESTSSSPSSSTTESTSTTTTTETSYLQITKWTSIVDVVQGSSKSTSIVVKNVAGSESQLVTLSAKNLPSGASSSISPSSLNLQAGESGEFTINLSVSESVGIGDYKSQLEASSNKASVTKDFTLRVLPSASSKLKIEANLENYTSEFEILWKELNSTKSSGVNVSSTEVFINQIKTKLEEARAQIALGTDEGYFAASQLLEEVANLLKVAKSQLKVDKQSTGFVFPIDPLYIGIGVGVVAIGFLVYLFLPTKGVNRGGMLSKAADAAGTIKDAAGSAAGKITDAASSIKDTNADQFRKLQEKFRLKKEFKYRYEE